MNQNFPRSNILINIAYRGIDDFRRNVIHIIGVDQIEDQAAWATGNKIFGMIFGGSTSSIAQCLPVIGFFAGMNDKPAALAANKGLINFRAHKQVRQHLNHSASLSASERLIVCACSAGRTCSMRPDVMNTISPRGALVAAR